MDLNCSAHLNDRDEIKLKTALFEKDNFAYQMPSEMDRLCARIGHSPR